MPFFFISVLFAGLLPYVWIGYAKFSQRGYDNKNPRDFVNHLDGARRRAHWAHLNAFEAFPFFAAAVVVAYLQAVNVETLNILCAVFLGCRILHGVFYIADQATLRSLAWFGGIACIVAIFINAWQTGAVE